MLQYIAKDDQVAALEGKGARVCADDRVVLLLERKLRNVGLPDLDCSPVLAGLLVLRVMPCACADVVHALRINALDQIGDIGFA